MPHERGLSPLPFSEFWFAALADPNCSLLRDAPVTLPGQPALQPGPVKLLTW